MSHGRRAIACVGVVIVGWSMALAGTAAAAPGDVVFGSAVLRDCVNASSVPTLPAGTTVTQAQAETVVNLVCTGKDVTDLTGIESLTNVQTIDFSQGTLTDLRPLFDPALADLTMVTAEGMHRTLTDIPVGQWQPNIVWFRPAGSRLIVPGANIGIPAEFDAANDNWKFTDAHAAALNEATLLWNVSGPVGPFDISFTGSLTQSAIWLPPTVTAPASLTVKAGLAAEFTASATSNQAPTVQWQQLVPGGSWADLPGETTPTLTIPTTTHEQTGTQFRAVFTNSAGTVNSDPATLTVVEPAYYTSQPVAQTTGVGGSVEFSADFMSDSENPHVIWEYSTDGGATWQNTDTVQALAAGPEEPAAAAFAASGWVTTLSLSGVPADMDGWLFHAVVWDEYTDPMVTSEAARLTVTATPVSPTPSPTVTTPSARATGSSVLARTGSTVLPIALGALALVGGGAGVLAWRRRRSA